MLTCSLASNMEPVVASDVERVVSASGPGQTVGARSAALFGVRNLGVGLITSLPPNLLLRGAWPALLRRALAIEVPCSLGLASSCRRRELGSVHVKQQERELRRHISGSMALSVLKTAWRFRRVLDQALIRIAPVPAPGAFKFGIPR